MPQKLPYKTFRTIYSKVPRLCVDLVILNKQNEVLLTFRKIPPKGLWHLPGGTILFGETPEETAQRVAKEELGQKIVIKKLLGIINYDPASYKRITGIGHPVSIAYLASLTSNTITLDKQATKFKFHTKLPQKIFKEQKKFLSKTLYPQRINN